MGTDGEDETGEGDGLEVDEPAEDELEAPPRGLGALGQLAAAVLVVSLLIALLVGGSALVRRLLG